MHRIITCKNLCHSKCYIWTRAEAALLHLYHLSLVISILAHCTSQTAPWPKTTRNQPTILGRFKWFFWHVFKIIWHLQYLSMSPVEPLQRPA